MARTELWVTSVLFEPILQIFCAFWINIFTFWTNIYNVLYFLNQYFKYSVLIRNNTSKVLCFWNNITIVLYFLNQNCKYSVLFESIFRFVLYFLNQYFKYSVLFSTNEIILPMSCTVLSEPIFLIFCTFWTNISHVQGWHGLSYGLLDFCTFLTNISKVLYCLYQQF